MLHSFASGRASRSALTTAISGGGRRRRLVAVLAATMLASSTVVLSPALPARAAAWSVTIVASGGAAEDSGWTYDATTGVLSPTADVNINAANLVAKLADRDLTVLGTVISVEASIVSPTANALVLKSDTDITVDAGVRIETAGGDVVFWADAGGDLEAVTRDGGGIRLGVDRVRGAGADPCPATPAPDLVEVVTAGGDIVLSGGSVADVAALATHGTASYREGGAFTRACSEYFYAVGIFGADLDARAGAGDDGGDIVIRGDALDFAGMIWTVQIGGAFAGVTSVRTSGAGTIAVRGNSGETVDGGGGVACGSNTSRNPWGIVSGARHTTDSGTIMLVGISNGPRGCNPRGVVLGGVVESVSGGITIHDQTVSTNHGNSGPFINGARIGVGDLGGSASEVLIIADRFAFGASTVATAGRFTLRSNGASFLDALTYPIAGLTSTDIGALTLGKAGNTSNITIASAVPTIPGDVMLHGNTLAVNGTLATGATLMLDAAVAATQTAAITAADLRLTGAGTFTLTSDANQIGTVAGGTVASPLGAASVVDASGGLAIGTTGGDGIVAVGPIDIATVEGDITLRADLSTDDGSGDAIVINAGRSRLPGDADGGDISVSGTPVLTTGTGGIVRLFSGGQAQSTGLTALVGGAGNIRFGVDETSTMSPVLLAGARYALYRETTPSGGVTAGSSSEVGGGGGAAGPGLACTPDPVVAGGTVTCRVTDGPPNADILWRAGLDADGAEPFAGGPVRTDGSGAGTFVFRAPRGASGARLDVELVAWSVDTAVRIVGGPVPASVPAGEGPAMPVGLLAFGLLAASGAVVAVRRQVVAG